MRPPFPEVIDSSLIAAFRSCPQKAFLEFFLHWKSQEPSVHLIAGAAYAKGLEVARKAFFAGELQTPYKEEELNEKTGQKELKIKWKIEQGDPVPEQDAIAMGVSACFAAYGDFQCPDDSAKSPGRTAGALEYYFEQYPMSTDLAIPMTLPGGKKGIEFSFIEPLDALHPETGQPLLYSGRMDMLVTLERMALGEDDKTTSQLGASWPRQWDLRSQFTSYVWGAGRAGIKLDGFLVRGVSILKTKYDTLQAITYRPQWQIDRWYSQLLADVRRMVECWESGFWDYNLDHACAEYGGCPFRQVCLMKETDQILEQRFQRRRWDPVARTETVL